MENGNKFPWEVLKAECLRLVCQQVCATTQPGLTNSLGKREEMIGFLRDVNARGLDAALKTLGKTKQTRRVGKESTSSIKRKTTDEDGDEDEDADGAADDDDTPEAPTSSHQAYNTRFRGVKRVKMGREVPEGLSYLTPRRRGRPRKTAPAASSSASTTDAGPAKVDPVKRGRGRPRKNPAPQVGSGILVTPNSARRPPASGVKQVFDGVEVIKRSPKKAPLDNAPEAHHDPDADADGDEDGEVDENGKVEETVWPDPAELNGLTYPAGQIEQDPQGSNHGELSAP